MLLKIALGLALVVAAFLIYVAFQPRHFRVERQILIQAAPEKIFPHLNDVRAADAWNPFMKGLTDVTKNFSSPTAGVGAFLRWRAKGTAGLATMIESRANEGVKVRLDFEEPFRGTNTAIYSLKPTPAGTQVSWAMEGEASFVPRALCALRVFSLDKMVGGEFEKGLADLKAIAEAN